jgi:hypothetical protein
MAAKLNFCTRAPTTLGAALAKPVIDGSNIYNSVISPRYFAPFCRVIQSESCLFW